MSHKGIKWVTGIFLVMFIADFISTLLNGPLTQHLEANPLYSFLGLPGLAILNLGVAAVFYYGYQYSNNLMNRHAFIFTFVMVSLFRVFIVYNNIKAYLNPIPIEVAASIPQEVKTKYYLIVVMIPLLFVWAVGMISFYFFKKDHKIKIIK